MKRVNALLVFLLILSFLANAQKKKTDLIDLFYQEIAEQDLSKKRGASDFVEISLQDYDNELINPQAIIARYPEAKKFMLNDSLMGVDTSVIIQGFIEDLSTTDSRIIIENFHFKKRVDLNLSLYGDLENEVFNASRLIIKGCTFDDQFETFFTNFVIRISDNKIKEFTIINESVTAPKITLEKNVINHLVFWTAEPGEVTIAQNQIGYLEIDLSSFRSLKLLKNTISGIETFQSPQDDLSPKNKWISTIKTRRATSLIALGQLPSDSIPHYLNNRNTLFQINSLDRVTSELKVIGNSFLDKTHSQMVIFAQKSITMEVSNNTFETPVIMAPSVSEKFILENNSFHSISMNAAMPSTPQNEVSVDWQDLKGKLYYQKHEDSPAYFGLEDEDFANPKQFFKLMAGYSRLLEVYKSYGNLDDANDVFLDMKALHLKRYDYNYRTKGGTTNFFQLYLNKLLSVYTRHGTDPAQAMTASLWIIIFFSFIYFFFPSDWDASSKSNLIKTFNTFIQKNEKGYLRPFLELLKGLVTSFFNAITLSVNSFVTLGFGTIPTKGLAKYICIFQGFLGWFLLSIFIVALINQILI